MFTKLLRRIHLYAGLFLAPWVLMYALSTMVMNHKALFADKSSGAPAWEKRAERTFNGALSPDAPVDQRAATILAWLGMDGAFNARWQEKQGALVIQRQRLLDPVRITYTPADKRVVVEGQNRGTSALLERMHRRRGFERDYAADDSWAFIVDSFIVVMLFWVISGFWLWWQMKAVRGLGFVFAAAGQTRAKGSFNSDAARPMAPACLPVPKAQWCVGASWHH